MGAVIDLTGQRFGRLTVIEKDVTASKSHGAYWICRCKCGNVKSILSQSLRNGATQSCGCLNKEIISGCKDISNMVGRKFGKLTVISRNGSYVSPSGQSHPQWLCQCECGNHVIVSSHSLKSGHTKSCGCLPTKPKNSGIIDLIGKRFGSLVVIERSEDYIYTSKDKSISSPRWLCLCDCGNTKVVQGGNLRNGNTTNCGCQRIISKGELKVAQTLSDNNIRYLREYQFDDLRNQSGNLLRFDFAVLNCNNNLLCLLEYQGEQHYKDCGSYGLYQRKYSDQIKRNYCKANNIPLYEIKYNSLDSDLSEIITNLKQQLTTTETIC